ncbi:hypothetical protein NQ487_20025 [Hungatella hathewayi]|uniref:hypothetical protein n=1 Tax=Hungatella hathewayi TaxID=154046 RepID=UPI0021A77091|nr:hypothetical protein [Hungatella hathewayi]UWO83159.1 hypothetical protein NQ487_20025 [Hungatella hathewayi]
MKELVISIISLVIGYFISKFLQRYTEKRARTIERFEKLYSPFEKMIWINTHGAFNFSDLEPELQKQFFELLFNNYEYADAELKELLMRFKWEYDCPGGNIEDANKFFFMIECRISVVFNVLSKKLFLEPYNIKYASKIIKKFDKIS